MVCYSKLYRVRHRLRYNILYNIDIIVVIIIIIIIIVNITVVMCGRGGIHQLYEEQFRGYNESYNTIRYTFFTIRDGGTTLLQVCMYI